MVVKHEQKVNMVVTITVCEMSFMDERQNTHKIDHKKMKLRKNLKLNHCIEHNEEN
jgi:hypothetical protein